MSLFRSVFLAWILLLVLPILTFSQDKEPNQWRFGGFAALHFNSGPPVVVTGSAMSMFEGCSSIADSMTGALLMYTNGLNVWNANNLVMANGTGLMGGSSSSQSAIIVPSPANDGKYYIFTVNTGASGLRYSIVDMTLNGGLGGVTATKNVLLVANTTEQQCAVRHANCRDVWVITHLAGNNSYYAYLVTPTGISGPVITSTGNNSAMSLGNMKASPDGSRLAIRRTFNPDNNQICDFDNTTGVVSNCYDIATAPDYDNYGSSFSPNSNIFYVASYGTQKVNQYDLLAGSPAAVNASKFTIASALVNRPASMQNAPDGKLYCIALSSTTLHVINSPNTLGAGCGWVTNGLSLGAGQAQLGLPNLDESYYSTTACNVVLPVEWLNFDLQLVNENVNLVWSVSAEDIQDHFEVLRSQDLTHWTELGKVYQPAPNSDEHVLYYRFTDTPKLNGEVFYKIRNIDLNGSHQYSEVRSVNIANDKLNLVLAPNPVQKGKTVKVVPEYGSSSAFTLYVFDILGSKMLEKEMKGGEECTIETSEMVPGTYFVKIVQDERECLGKLVVQ